MNKDRFTYNTGELMIADRLCDACIYRDENNEKICQKYPNGKPKKILKDKDCWCNYFSVIDSGDDLSTDTKNSTQNKPVKEKSIEDIINNIEKTIAELKKNQ